MKKKKRPFHPFWPITLKSDRFKPGVKLEEVINDKGELIHPALFSFEALYEDWHPEN